MLLVADAKPRRTKKPQRKRRERVPKKVNVAKIVAFTQRVTPRYCDLGLLLTVIGLAAFGILMIYSASHYNANVYYGQPFYYTWKQLAGLGLGLVGLVMMYWISYRMVAKWAYVIFGVAVVLLVAVFIPGISISKLGATRWVGIGGFSIQPSEIAKFAFVIFAAKIFARPGKVTTDSTSTRLRAPKWWQTLLVLGAGGILCLLIILEPNMSITMTVGIIMFVMLYLCGVSWKTLLMIIVPAIGVVALMLVAEPYRLKRLSAFVDPWANPKGEGFQLIESLYAIANGGFWGVGYGNSIQKYQFLPFSESDFIFAIIAEEFGLLGCWLLFAVFGLIIYKSFRIGRQCSDYFGRYLCYGIGTVILVQASLNFAVSTGCIPPTGLPLPFVSFGGTSLLVFMMAIGVVLNIDKQNKKRREELLNHFVDK